MKRLKLLFTMLMLAMSAAVFAQEGTTMELWPNGAPNASSDKNDKAELIVYLPDAKKATGRAVVCCPGGGYTNLAMDHEGHQWVAFFNNQGIALIVLKYRMPHGNRLIPISDAEEAIKTVRRRAVLPSGISILQTWVSWASQRVVISPLPLPRILLAMRHQTSRFCSILSSRWIWASLIRARMITSWARAIRRKNCVNWRQTIVTTCR